ncbi:hypothetical protein CDAR_513292 [Caerostris darwini]|uniref:IRF tryptophan pentad repeat domain-containing protein n=1 Tax=Caerostris darwini TaxID=1538125 RepID=A0AAV4X0E6_9ARAC|nr:hypothetical protein CDAR_513292 [Caerostris darwini]
MQYYKMKPKSKKVIRRRRSSGNMPRSNVLKYIVQCLLYGVHEHMLQWKCFKSRTFVVVFVHKSSQSWNEMYLDLFKALDKMSPSYKNYLKKKNYLCSCKTRCRSNLTKLCDKRYISFIGETKPEKNIRVRCYKINDCVKIEDFYLTNTDSKVNEKNKFRDLQQLNADINTSPLSVSSIEDECGLQCQSTFMKNFAVSPTHGVTNTVTDYGISEWERQSPSTNNFAVSPTQGVTNTATGYGISEWERQSPSTNNFTVSPTHGVTNTVTDYGISEWERQSPSTNNFAVSPTQGVANTATGYGISEWERQSPSTNNFTVSPTHGVTNTVTDYGISEWERQSPSTNNFAVSPTHGVTNTVTDYGISEWERQSPSTNNFAVSPTQGVTNTATDYGRFESEQKSLYNLISSTCGVSDTLDYGNLELYCRDVNWYQAIEKNEDSLDQWLEEFTKINGEGMKGIHDPFLSSTANDSSYYDEDAPYMEDFLMYES